MMSCHLSKESTISKDEVKRFLDTHPDKEISAAKLEYSLYLTPKMLEIANDFSEKYLKKSDEDILMEKRIEDANEVEELLLLMRKPMSAINRVALRKRIMEYEEDLLPLIKERCLRNKQDIFIENALHYFLYSQTNHCKWIIESYSKFQSEYLKSLLCLVLGFRGRVEMIPFLMEEARRFESRYPDETYDQGPALAVQELAARYLN